MVNYSDNYHRDWQAHKEFFVFLLEFCYATAMESQTIPSSTVMYDIYITARSNGGD